MEFKCAVSASFYQFICPLIMWRLHLFTFSLFDPFIFKRWPI